MAIEIVSFPIKNGDFPISYVKLPKGNKATMEWSVPSAPNSDGLTRPGDLPPAVRAYRYETRDWWDTLW